MLRDAGYVLDMRTAARHARDFVAGMTAEAFLADVKTQSAVLRQLTVLGEAVRRVSEEFRAAHPQIAWKDIAGLRSTIIHDYDDIDLDQVWRILATDVPALIPQLEAIVGPEPK